MHFVYFLSSASAGEEELVLCLKSSTILSASRFEDRESVTISSCRVGRE
jgi:hypothetical protein